jgi:hypothetical protein
VAFELRHKVDVMKNEQVNEVVAMLMIGDCVLGALAPERHVRLWKIGPPRLRQALEGLAHRPNLTRMISIGGLALGIWWALRQAADRSFESI